MSRDVERTEAVVLLELRLAADQPPDDAADDRAARLLRAAAFATGHQRDDPEHRQDSYRAHDELPHWM